MRFELREGFVVFHDEMPGNHAEMSGPHGAMAFRGDASSFSDAERRYAWAFEWRGEIKNGDQFVFSTTDRWIVGEVRDGEIVRLPAVGLIAPLAAAPTPSGLVPLRNPRAAEKLPSASARCMFVNPCIPYNQWACYRAGVMNEASFSSHGSAYVSAALKAKGHSCWLVDARSHNNWAHFRDVLAQQEYDVAFVGFLSIDVFHAAAVVRLLKELHPSRPVVVGGLHVSIAKERVFPRPDLVDYYCFHGDTKVVTRDGVLTLRDLAGTTRDVLSRDGIYRPCEFKSFGHQELWEVEFLDGTTVLATAEHRWPTVNSSKSTILVPTTKLEGRDLIRNVAPRPPRNDDFFDGVCHGFVFGDGTAYNDGKQTRACFFGKKDREMLKFFEGRGSAPVEDDNGTMMIHGLPASWKTLPESERSASYWYGFVCGFFAADGCVRHDGYAVLTQKSKATLAYVADQLPRIGMVAGKVCSYTRESAFEGGYEYENEICYVALLKQFLQPDDLLLSSHRTNFENNYKPTRYGTCTRVRAVRRTGLVDEVFCGVEMETHTLTLSNGVLTGNCWGNHQLLPESFLQFLAFKGEDRYMPERYPLADYVILDDGEIAAQELVAELAAGRRPAQRTWDGGAVPMEVARHMDRDLFRLDFEANSPILPFQPTPMVTVTWARGCPFHCRYCNLASQLSNTNVREKPVELVEEELDDLHRRLGGRLGSLMIHDDLTFHPKHIAQWCELILRKYGPIPIWMQTRSDWIVSRYRRDRSFWELICRAGLTWVSVGYESGSQRVLDYMGKDSTVEKNLEAGRILDEYGINSFGNFLWGVPTETHEEAEATVQLVEKIKPGFLSGSVYCNYPGTQMDAECREKGHLVAGSVYARSHLPWQVTVKGIDYPHVFDCVTRAGRHANYLRMPKLLSAERQRDLAATTRGLPIHAAGAGA